MKRAFIPLMCAAAAIALCQAPPAGGPQRGPGGPQGGGMRGGMSYFMLFMPEVQREVGLSEAQKGQIQKIMQGAMGGPGMGGPPPRQGGPSKDGPGPKPGQGVPNMGDMQKRMQDMEAKVGAILKPAQKARLEELALQAQGPMALQRTDVAKKLGLSGKQQSTIEGIVTKARPQFNRQGAGNAAPDFEKIRKEMQAKRDAANKAILATLTADQKAKWAKMTGKPFKFPEMRMGGRMGGGMAPGGGAGRPPTRGGGGRE